MPPIDVFNTRLYAAAPNFGVFNKSTRSSFGSNADTRDMRTCQETASCRSLFRQLSSGIISGELPIGNCLNKDLHEAISQHVLMSSVSALDPKDERVFLLKTPKLGAAAYKRVWNTSMGGVAPPSNRIIQDIKKVVQAMRQIMVAKGAFVPNLT